MKMEDSDSIRGKLLYEMKSGIFAECDRLPRENILAEIRYPIYDFLPRFCEVSSYMDLTEIHAMVADERLAGLLEIPVGSPNLNLEEVDYDIGGRAIFYSKEYFVDSLFLQTVLRKKL